MEQQESNMMTEHVTPHKLQAHGLNSTDLSAKMMNTESNVK